MKNFYMPAALAIAFAACIMVYRTFDRHSTNIRRTMLIAVMTALSVISRHVFAAVPLKPMAAIIIMTGSCLGGEAGFLCGSFTALISNITFGQGPWTVFQMLAFGLIGFFAGFIPKHADNPLNTLIRELYAGAGGVFYSLFVDIWSVLWANGSFDFSYYFTLCIAALPYTISYVFSNVIFLYFFDRYFGKKLGRIISRYEI